MSLWSTEVLCEVLSEKWFLPRDPTAHPRTDPGAIVTVQFDAGWSRGVFTATGAEQTVNYM